MEYEYDLCILGAGPGGYVGAIRAAQLGMKAAVVEKDKAGGVCLNMGCIPSKALIRQAEIFSDSTELEEMGVTLDRSGFDYAKVQEKSRAAADTLSKGVAYLLKKNQVELIQGTGELTGEHEITVDGDRRVSARYLMVATGSRPMELPGFETDGEKVLNSDHVLLMKELPERVLILGGGIIGCEFAHIMRAFGTEVTIVEMLDQLVPNEDPEAARILTRSFKKRKLKSYTSSRAVSLDRSGSGVQLEVETKKGTETFSADQLIVSVGRAPNTAGIGLENLGIETNKGFVKVGDYYRTSVPSVYAVGDITPSPLLAHVATREAEIAVEHMAGRAKEKRIDPRFIPSAVYTEPQLASFGLTEEQAAEQGYSAASASFPYKGAGKAVAVGMRDGMVKLTYDTQDKTLLGGVIVGAEATELIHELLIAARSGLTTDDIAETIHAHPTLSEAVHEAALAAGDGPIHV
jgi:dihydrolipoamide dehydrogenase